MNKRKWVSSSRTQRKNPEIRSGKSLEISEKIDPTHQSLHRGGLSLVVANTNRRVASINYVRQRDSIKSIS